MFGIIIIISDAGLRLRYTAHSFDGKILWKRAQDETNLSRQQFQRNECEKMEKKSGFEERNNDDQVLECHMPHGYTLCFCVCVYVCE